MEGISQVPVVGTAGHTIGYGATTITDAEKASIQKVCGCPVNRKMPVRMSRASFRAVCLKFQDHAGITSRKQGGKVLRMAKNGFRSNSKHICPTCATGKAVRNNKPFEAPCEYITFADIQPVGVYKNPKAPRRQASQKLNEEQAKRIRRMHQEGYSNADYIHSGGQNHNLEYYE